MLVTMAPIQKLFRAFFFTFLIAGIWCGPAYGQIDTVHTTEFEILGRKDKRTVIPFELVNNLIIIEASINGSIPMKFILDTGVASTLLTSLPVGEELYLAHTRTITLSGLGEGNSIEAFYSDENFLSIKNIIGRNVEVLFLKKDIFNLSSFMGTHVHGIIGYDLFANFAVEVNYKSREVYVYDLEAFEEKFRLLPNHSKWFKYPLIIQDKKPYIEVQMQHTERESFSKLRLLIDSGASNAFSLYEKSDESIRIPQSNMETLIGVGLSGNVNGRLGRIAKMKMGAFTFKEPVIAYPDSLAIRQAFTLGDRNGSLGGDILRRFKVIFNYRDGYILMRKNRDFKDKFYYNISGIEVHTPVPDLPVYVVSQVREGSPAAIEGVMEGDVIKRINGRSTAQLNLNELVNYLQRSREPRIELEVRRDSRKKTFKFELRNELLVDSGELR